MEPIVIAVYAIITIAVVLGMFVAGRELLDYTYKRLEAEEMERVAKKIKAIKAAKKAAYRKKKKSQVVKNAD